MNEFERTLGFDCYCNEILEVSGKSIREFKLTDLIQFETIGSFIYECFKSSLLFD